MRFILTAAILCISAPAWATTFEGVIWLRCYDGDTCTFTIPSVHPFFGEKISVRIRGIDTLKSGGSAPLRKGRLRPRGTFFGICYGTPGGSPSWTRNGGNTFG